MGYTEEALTEIINFWDKRKQFRNENREKFRQALADLGHAEATLYTHWALEAYDKVHYPDLRKEKEENLLK